MQNTPLLRILYTSPPFSAPSLQKDWYWTKLILIKEFHCYHKTWLSAAPTGIFFFWKLLVAKYVIIFSFISVWHVSLPYNVYWQITENMHKMYWKSCKILKNVLKPTTSIPKQNNSKWHWQSLKKWIALSSVYILLWMNILLKRRNWNALPIWIHFFFFLKIIMIK